MMGSSERLILCVDGSVDVRSMIGYGAYIAVPEPGSELSLAVLTALIKVKKFDNTSSTKLELQTLLWALGDIEPAGRKVIVYTDSQNIVGLRGRRDRLEKNDYLSSKNKRLKNAELYREFFKLTDLLDCEFIKVRGHLRANQKSDIDQLFSLVDRASREALRNSAI